MQATMTPTDETACVMTEAGLEALRLADALDGPIGAQSGADNGGGADAAPETFTPDTPEKADWVLCKIADAHAKAARIRENMELMAREAERDAERLEWQFGAALQAFARKETEGGRKKSVRLPNGVLGFRTKPAGVQIADTGAALAWAKQHLPAAVVETQRRN